MEDFVHEQLLAQPDDVVYLIRDEGQTIAEGMQSKNSTQ